MYALAAVFATIGTLAAAQSHRCDEYPDEWKARITAFDPNQRDYHNHTSTYQIRGVVAFSAKLRARKVIEEAHFGDEKHEDLIDVLELYNEKKAYIVNPRTKECRTEDIRRPFIPYRPFEWANFTGTESLGEIGSDNVLYAARFEGEGDIEGQHIFTYQTFAEKSCVPVRSDYFDHDTGFHYEQIYDVDRNVDDRDFEIPDICKKN